MIKSNRRYISRKFNLPTPNPFFIEVAQWLHAALITSPKNEVGLLLRFYTTTRLSNYPEESRSALLKRMPPDLHFLASGARSPDKLALDILEMDLIDFLLHYSDNRVLSIVGPVGIGKSTYMRYVLETVRSRVASLSRFVPIIVDCLGILAHSTLDELCRKLLKECFASIPPDAAEETTLDVRYQEIQQNGRPIPSSVAVEILINLQRILQNKYEFVIVFDNVDQLSPEAVSSICDFARVLFYETGFAVLICMRPTTYTAHLEVSHDRGAFLRYLISVTPPDLREIIRRRLRYAFGNYKAQASVGIKDKNLLFTNVEKALNRMCDTILDPTAQLMIVQGLSNNNIRKALFLLEQFLRYKDLKFRYLLPGIVNSREEQGESHDLQSSRYWSEHLLDGMMHGENRYYDSTSSLVPNVLVFDPVCDEPRYLLLHRILVVLDWSARVVKMDTFVRWMAVFGYRPEVVRLAVNHLLAKALIYSPETEHDLDASSHVMISESGAFFLHDLIKDRQYLYNAIYDVPLPHLEWQPTERDYYAFRLHSVYELLCIVLDEEKKQLEHVREHLKKNSQWCEAIYALHHSGLLISSLIAAALKILAGGKMGTNDHARAAAESYEPRFEGIETEMMTLHKVLDDLANVYRKPSGELEDIINIPIGVGSSSESFIRIPAVMDPVRHNVVEMQLDLAGYTPHTPETPVVVLWEGSVGKQKCSDFFELERQPGRSSIYTGSLVLPSAKAAVACEPFTATVVMGTTLVATVNASDPTKYLQVHI